MSKREKDIVLPRVGETWEGRTTGNKGQAATVGRVSRSHGAIRVQVTTWPMHLVYEWSLDYFLSRWRWPGANAQPGDGVKDGAR